jgi:predicted amidohydrolase
MRIAGAALNQIPIDWSTNLRNIRTAIEQAKAAGVELLCLPELCLTGYGCEDLFLSDWMPQTALAHLQLVRPWTQGICVVVGLPVRLNGAHLQHGRSAARRADSGLCGQAVSGQRRGALRNPLLHGLGGGRNYDCGLGRGRVAAR